MNNDYRRDTEYWNEYYSKNYAPTEKSSFAEYILNMTKKGKRILDCGCGNGRDSIFFYKNDLIVTSVDASSSAIEILKKSEYGEKINFLCADFVESNLVYDKKYDYIYSRFTLHAITDEQEKIFFDNAITSLNRNGLFMIEARSIHDDLFGKGIRLSKNEFFYNNHYRRFIDINSLVDILTKKNLEIIYAAEQRGFAKYENQDPYIVRIIAQKT